MTDLHLHSSSPLVVVTHQVGEEGHVVSHLHTSGDRDRLTGEEAVSSYQGQDKAQQQKWSHFHFLQTSDFTAWLGLTLNPSHHQKIPIQR